MSVDVRMNLLLLIIKHLIVNRQRRLTEQDKSLFKIPPDTAESTIVHDLFLNTIVPR